MQEDQAGAWVDLVFPDDPEKIFELGTAQAHSFLEGLAVLMFDPSAYGVVYKAKDRRNGRIVAIKKMLISVENADLIRKEIVTLREIKCANCVEYLGSYYKDANLFLIMEFFEGGSIGGTSATLVMMLICSDLLTTKKVLPEAQIGAILAQAIPALEYLHAQKKIHRDMKASNLLLNAQGVVKLCITSTIEDGKKRETQVGSPFWMAPEIISGEGYDQQADVWSVGITAFEMAESEHPFFNLNPMTAMFQIVSDPIPKLTNLPSYSAPFLNFIDICLNKDPAQRATIKQLLQHPFIKKYQASPAKQELVKLFQDVCGPKLVKTGSSGSLDALASLSAPRKEEQRVLKFAMPDKSFRSLLVKTDDTARDICQQLRKKVGLEDSESYSLYYVTKGDERCIDPEEKILTVQKTQNALHFAFKETPDTKAFNTLTAIFNNLKAGAPNKPTSILRSPNDLKTFVQVILDRNLSIVGALTEVVPTDGRDQLVQSLVPLFESQNQTPRLIKKVGKREIANAEQLGNMLRGGQTLLCKLMSTYGKLVASKYLKKILLPVLAEIVALPEALELDTQRFKTQMDLKKQLVQLTINIQKMQQLASALVQNIIASFADLPLPICYIARDLQIICAHFFRFEWKYIVPYSFVFGQIICPALVAPRFFGVTDETYREDTNRTLILLSKTLQALAACKPFETQDCACLCPPVTDAPDMSVMNVFLQEHKPAMENFHDQVLKRETVGGVRAGQRAEIAPVELQKAVLYLSTLLEEKRIEIGIAMNVLPKGTPLNSPGP